MDCPTCKNRIRWKMKKGKGKCDLKCPCGFTWGGYKKEIDANTLIGNWNCSEIGKLNTRMKHYADHNFTFFKGRKIYSYWLNNSPYDLSKLRIARSLTGLLRKL